MSFTEAELLAQIQGEGSVNVVIQKFMKGAIATAVYVENYNQTARKAGWASIVNTSTAAQAETLLEAALNP